MQNFIAQEVLKKLVDKAQKDWSARPTKIPNMKYSAEAMWINMPDITPFIKGDMVRLYSTTLRYLSTIKSAIKIFGRPGS